MDDFRRFKETLARIRFVLVSPTHPGNVGASARAMQAMGFRQLWLANAEDPKIAHRADAVALSSGAAQVLTDAKVVDLSEALGPTTWSCALSARVREFEPPRLSLEEASDAILTHLLSDEMSQAAFVFGSERNGLTNDQLLSCRHVCSLDVDEKFSSLNLSQAVQVVAYATRRALRERFRQGQIDLASMVDDLSRIAGNQRETAKPADHAAVEGLHDHLVRVAIRIGYLDPEVPGRFEERLKRLLARKEMWEDEVQMLRGLCTEIERRT